MCLSGESHQLSQSWNEAVLSCHVLSPNIISIWPEHNTSILKKGGKAWHGNKARFYLCTVFHCIISPSLATLTKMWLSLGSTTNEPFCLRYLVPPNGGIPEGRFSSAHMAGTAARRHGTSDACDEDIGYEGSTALLGSRNPLNRGIRQQKVPPIIQSKQLTKHIKKQRPYHLTRYHYRK